MIMIETMEIDKFASGGRGLGVVGLVVWNEKKVTRCNPEEFKYI